MRCFEFVLGEEDTVKEDTRVTRAKRTQQRSIVTVFLRWIPDWEYGDAVAHLTTTQIQGGVASVVEGS